MVDETGTGAAGAEQDQEDAEKPRTQYRVQVGREMGADADGEGPLWVAWVDVGVLNVPRRTQRATVLNQAGQIAAEYAGRASLPTPVRFRVMPEDDVQEGQAELETPPPQLKVTAL